jgi:hypothetical protein
MEQMMQGEPRSSKTEVEIQPPDLNFGDLRPGRGALARVSVRGASGIVSVHSDHLKISPMTFQEEDNLEFELLGGKAGELLWEEVVLTTAADEMKVLVTARWTEHPIETPHLRDSIVTLREPPLRSSAKQDQRRFNGRTCLSCGKNFGYDVDTKSWEECKCTTYQRVRNIVDRMVGDVRRGVKDLPAYLREMWGVVTGKEKW